MLSKTSGFSVERYFTPLLMSRAFKQNFFDESPAAPIQPNFNSVFFFFRLNSNCYFPSANFESANKLNFGV